jgi:hypothetical protein
MARPESKPPPPNDTTSASSGPASLRSATRAHSIADMRRFYTTLILGVIGGAVVLAQDAQTPQERLTPKEIKWPAAAATVGTFGAAGLQRVVLKGDPSKAGLYTMLLRVPPNTKIQAHSHKDDRTGISAMGASSMRLL